MDSSPDSKVWARTRTRTRTRVLKKSTTLDSAPIFVNFQICLGAIMGGTYLANHHYLKSDGYKAFLSHDHTAALSACLTVGGVKAGIFLYSFRIDTLALNGFVIQNRPPPLSRCEYVFLFTLKFSFAVGLPGGLNFLVTLRVGVINQWTVLGQP